MISFGFTRQRFDGNYLHVQTKRGVRPWIINDPGEKQFWPFFLQKGRL